MLLWLAGFGEGGGGSQIGRTRVSPPIPIDTIWPPPALCTMGQREREREIALGQNFELTGGSEPFFPQSVLQMPGFRSLGDDEVVEYKAESSGKGLEATEVR